MTKPNDITVVIPAYQSELFVSGTLAAVAKQTIRPHEVIVVDDGSTDATCAVVESFALAHPELSVRLLRKPHDGPGATRNAGVRAAASEWIAFLDSDDLWYPEKLAKIQNAMEANPEANFYYHNLMARSLAGVERVAYRGKGLSSGKTVSSQLFRRNYFSTSSVVCRRDLVLRWGGFDETLPSAQDYELWLRMSPDMVPVFVPEVLGTYVDRKGNISTSRFWKRLIDLLRVKHRHRTKGGVGFYVYCILYAVVVHITTPIRDSVKRVLMFGIGR
ncbi:MAG: glycosyltransferase family 2 protein [Nitrospirota bacterium]